MQNTQIRDDFSSDSICNDIRRICDHR